MTHDAVEFRGYPLQRQVEVVCGLPPRPRPLDLFVIRRHSYMWGAACPETTELAAGMLEYAIRFGLGLTEVELPDPGFCEAFAGDVLVPLPADQEFTLELEEVFAWLDSRR